MTFRRLLGFLRPYRGQVIVSAVLAAGTQAAGLVIPYLTGAVIDSAQRGDGRRHIYALALLIVAAGAVKGVMMLFPRWPSSTTCETASTSTCSGSRTGSMTGIRPAS